MVHLNKSAYFLIIYYILLIQYFEQVSTKLSFVSSY